MIEPSVDYSGSAAVADSPVQPCHPDDPTPTLTSETYAMSPADRTRLKLGVGEQVTLVYAPGGATWAISGNGAVSFAEGDDPIDSVTFTAGDTAGSITITATGQYGACSLTFEVVAPSTITQYKRSGTPLKHQNGRVENGFQAYIYLHPNDVNFYRVQIREKDSRATATGCSHVVSGVWHSSFEQDFEVYTIPDPPGGNVSEWVGMVNHSERYGSNTGGWDSVWQWLTNAVTGAAAPFNVGVLRFTIIWQWKVIGKTTVTNFPAIHQTHTITDDGKMQTRKAGESRSSNFDDPTTAPAGWDL